MAAKVVIETSEFDCLDWNAEEMTGYGGKREHSRGAGVMDECGSDYEDLIN